MKNIFDYDPLTGVITWKVTVNNRAKKGSEAGTLLDTGYRQIRFQGKTWKAHILAWFLHFGFWPKKDLDHKNKIRDDNRISNLRESSRSFNNHHTTKPNKTGFQGVTKLPSGKFSATIKVKGKKTYLGSFASAELASEAYEATAKAMYPEYKR